MENKVKFKIGEIEFEAEGSAEVVQREREVFLNALLPAAVDAIVRTRGTERATQYVIADETPVLLAGGKDEVSAVAGQSVTSIDWSRTSLSSYINGFGAISDRDFVLVAAYYDEKKNGIKSFSSESVKQYYAEARRQKYSNNSQLLLDLAKKGLIMDDPDAEKKTPKHYVITNEGIKYIENYQPQEQTEKKPTKSKKPRSKGKTSYEGINVDDLHLSNYPEIKNLHDFKEKMMMVMYIVTNEKVGEWFSTVDILYLLTDVFGEPATIGQVNGVFKREKLWFKGEYFEDNKKEMKRKLLNQGIDFAKSLMAKGE